MGAVDNHDLMLAEATHAPWLFKWQSVVLLVSSTGSRSRRLGKQAIASHVT
jgi:hypothetical protein